MPSIVWISAPSAWTASIVHDFALVPFTWTVHAPQLLVSQPVWVPVRPNSSRRRWTRRRRGSTSASRCLPLTVTVTCCFVIARSSGALCACGGLAERPGRDLADHRQLVVGGPVAVGDRLRLR